MACLLSGCSECWNSEKSELQSLTSKTGSRRKRKPVDKSASKNKKKTKCPGSPTTEVTLKRITTLKIFQQDISGNCEDYA